MSKDKGTKGHRYKNLDILVNNFNEDAQRIKDIERTTNHDVKLLNTSWKTLNKEHLKPLFEFIHFALNQKI